MNVATFLILFGSSQVAAQRCDVDSGFRGGYFRVGYEQRELVKAFESLDEIPQPVRSRLDEYLRKKLGDAFTQRLKFEQGEWLDLEKLRKQFPSVYEENTSLGSYDLTFSFSQPDKGLKAFFTKMALNDAGSIKVEIRLPDIRQNPEKAEIIFGVKEPTESQSPPRAQSRNEDRAVIELFHNTEVSHGSDGQLLPPVHTDTFRSLYE